MEKFLYQKMDDIYFGQLITSYNTEQGTKLTMQPVELYPFQSLTSWRIKTLNIILYNLVGIIKLSVTFQDQNIIDETLSIITKLPHCFTLSFVPVA